MCGKYVLKRGKLFESWPSMCCIHPLLKTKTGSLTAISDSPTKFTGAAFLSPYFKPSSVLDYHKLCLTIGSKAWFNFGFQTFCSCKETNAFRGACFKGTWEGSCRLKCSCCCYTVFPFSYHLSSCFLWKTFLFPYLKRMLHSYL